MYTEEEASQKLCPYINDKCLGKQCMMFKYAVTEYVSKEPIRLGGSAHEKVHYTIRQETIKSGAEYDENELYYCGIAGPTDYRKSKHD